MKTVEIDGVTIEIPRLVKKPGEFKRVETEQELRDALDDGWVLKLPAPTGIVLTDTDPFPSVLDDPDGGPPDEAVPDNGDAPVRRGPGRPRKNG